MDPTLIASMIKKAIADAEVQVTALTGTRNHYSVVVISREFEGKLPIKQHRMVNAALAAPLATGELHALQLATYSPAQWNAIQK